MKPQRDNRIKSQFEFGPFRLDPVKRILLRAGQPLPLNQKAFETLLVLVQNHERVVAKDELMTRVWPDTIVEENNLTQNISALRKALGESRKDHKYIVTFPGNGYRFVADVRENFEESADLILVGHRKENILIEEDAETDPRAHATVATGHPVLNRPFRARLTVAVVVALVAASCVLYFWKINRENPSDLNAVTVRSLAVLPFKSVRTEPGDEYLSSGISDALTAKLGHLKQITVLSSGAVLQSQNYSEDAITIGRKLQVDSVMDGIIQKDGDRISVTVRLMKVQDGKTIWSGNFNEKLTEILAMQDSISEQVVQALRLKLTGPEQEVLAKRQTESPEAFQAYVKGRYFWNKRTEAGLLKAIEYFRQAIRVDGNYALAYAGLADSYLMIASYGYGSLPHVESIEIAKSAAVKALELDETLAEAHTSLAGCFESTGQDLTAAEREYKRALELNPNYATARQWYGEFLRSRGRFEEALRELTRAQALDPLSPVMNTSLGVSYYYARQYDEAIEQNQKALEIDPNFTSAHFGLGLAFEQKGMYPDAIAEFQRAKDLSNGREPMIAALGHAYAKSGDRARALRALKELKERKPASAYNLAIMYVAFGEKDKALPLLQQARQKAVDLLMLKLDPRLDELRSDSTFRDVFKT